MVIISSQKGAAARLCQFAPVRYITWSFVRERIGQGLRDRYEVPTELPPKLQTLVLRVDAIEGNQLLHHSGTLSDRGQMVEARIAAGVKAFPIGSC